MAAGDNQLYFRVPATAALGYTFARFRLCSDPAQITLPTGPAMDGEVEDYRLLTIDVPLDYGDAPDPSYPTLKVSHGARHQVDFAHYLGTTFPTYEPDGQPNATATGDSGDNGVQFVKDSSIPGGPLTFENRLVPDRVEEIVVTASTSGILSAWIDFNGNGNWTDTYLDPAGDHTKDQADHVAFYTDSTLTTTAVDVPLVAGPNHLKFYVPKGLTASPSTFARFRFTDSAWVSAHGGLSFSGPDVPPYPVGEVEDYQVQIVVGDAKISGYVFNDLNANGQWEKGFFAPEPGLAGVTLYLDLNNNGVSDSGEPTTQSRTDDLTTSTVNETGYYEFTKLLPGPYVVREVIPDHWSNPLSKDWTETALYSGSDSRLGHAGIQTVGGAQLLDGQTFTLDDGTNPPKTFEFDKRLTPGGNGNGVTLGNVRVLFSDFPTSTPPVIDTPNQVATAIRDAINGATSFGITATAGTNVVSLTGPKVSFNIPTQPTPPPLVNLGVETLAAGQTVTDVDFGNYKMAHVTVSNVAVLEGNSGQTQANVTVHVTDSFGAPVTFQYSTADGTATTANSDYVPTSGTFTFFPQTAPAATWDVKQVTHNLTNNYNYSIWGSKVLYQGNSGIDNDIYLYDDATGVTRQISESSLDNCFASIHGNYVAWSGKANDGTDYEMFLYNVATGTIKRLTTNNVDDKGVQLSDRYAVWWSTSASGNNQIWAYDLVNGGAPVKDLQRRLQQQRSAGIGLARRVERRDHWLVLSRGADLRLGRDVPAQRESHAAGRPQLVPGRPLRAPAEQHGAADRRQQRRLAGVRHLPVHHRGDEPDLLVGRDDAVWHALDAEADQPRQHRQHAAADFRQQRGLASRLDGRRPDAMEPDRVVRPVQQHSGLQHLGDGRLRVFLPRRGASDLRQPGGLEQLSDGSLLPRQLAGDRV